MCMNRPAPPSSSLPPKARPKPLPSSASCRNAIGRELRRAVDEMAQEGMRVLAVARASRTRRFRRVRKRRAIFRSSFSALSALRIPCARPCRRRSRNAAPPASGSIMITGDYPQTARAIAAQANLEAGDIVTGGELEAHERCRS